jgi:signal transduction histidine kinase
MAIDLQNLPGPSRLVRYRNDRYVGDENAVSLDDLPAEDARILQELYALLLRSMEELRASIDAQDIDAARRRLDEIGWRQEVYAFARDFSSTRLSEERRERLRPTYHDLRGGALTVAGGRAELLFAEGVESTMTDVVALFNAVRDHLKIMRNLVRDIDPQRRAEDLTTNHHSAWLLRQKWSGYHDSSVELTFYSDYDGGISTCCLEFSSVDRAVYNLVTNAMRHTADGEISFFIHGKQSRPDRNSTTAPTDIQIATANTISEAERDELRLRFGEDIGMLFLGGFTIGGSGVGLSICAELVANAYGLLETQAAVDGGYVGARILGDTFVSWIHWPTVG